MVADPSSEIPGDEDFGRRVAAARAGRGLTQKQLAGRVGISQPAISAIEGGGSSSFIPEVCRFLRIPGPMYGWSDQQREWAILGHELERRSPASFKFAMQNLKQMLGEMPAPPTEKPPPGEPAQPKKKATPVAKANLAGHDREHSRRLRAADELPHESKTKR